MSEHVKHPNDLYEDGKKLETVKEQLVATQSDLEMVTDDRDNFKALYEQEQVLRDRTKQLSGELKEAKEELIKVLESVRRHGLIEKDGYETVVKMVGEAINKHKS